MMSNKWTFSLTILITILALAFTVPSVMAADDFDVGFSVTNTTYATSIEVTVSFKEEVPLENVQMAAITVHVENSGGVRNAITVPTTSDGSGTASATSTSEIMAKDINMAVAGLQTDRKQFVFTIDAASTTMDSRKIHLFIPAGVKRFNPDADKSSKMGSASIDLTPPAMANMSRPMVVSIQRLRPGGQTVAPLSAFEEDKVTGAFDVRIVFTEKPHDFKLAHIAVDGGTASALTVGVPFARIGIALTDPIPDALTATEAQQIAQTIKPHPLEGMYSHAGIGTLTGLPNPLVDATAGTVRTATADDIPMLVPMPTGTDNMYHQYRVTITPHRRADMVKVSIKEFHDNAVPYPNVYKPFNVENKPNGREQLRLTVDTTTTALGAGFKLYLPHSEGAKIPANGYYLLTRDKAGSGIRHFHEKDEENNAHKQTPAQLLYNVRASADLPNLEAFLANSGIIDLVSFDGDKDAYISEVMWGTDASQDPATKSQWIEIATGGGEIGIGEKKYALWFYQANETPPSAYIKEDGTTGVLIDRIGTKDAKGLSWSIAGKGQSGRTNIGAGVDVLAVSPTRKLASMYRVMDATTGEPADGQMASSWMATAPPGVNLALGSEGRYDATPGAAPIITAEQIAATAAAEKAKADAEAAAAEAKAKADTETGTIPMNGNVYISEVMVARGNNLPQWIEIANGSRSEEVNLSGWTLKVDNASADTDVSVGASITFTIPAGTMIGMFGQHDTPSTLLVVTEAGRTNLEGPMAKGQILNLWESNQTELILGNVTKRRYSLLSEDAFLITLAPPAHKPTPAPAGETAAAKAARLADDKKAATMRKEASDMVGNLGADGAAAWALPMSTEAGRSSIIRTHVPVTRGPAEPNDGMMMDGWALASETSFAQATHVRASSYFGAANDVGTPGFRAGGALPVELSHFRPARQKETGQVVITWATQSELNNAGFFIKRSQQRDGEFKVINATMVAGAGTTSEKQFYTYTDTTAQPNVVYYYQIEDVSLDGQRQTLTRGIRLKGHVGAAGKATTLWGELKSSNE